MITDIILPRYSKQHGRNSDSYFPLLTTLTWCVGPCYNDFELYITLSSICSVAWPGPTKPHIFGILLAKPRQTGGSEKPCCESIRRDFHYSFININGPSWGKSTSYRWISSQKASNAELGILTLLFLGYHTLNTIGKGKSCGQEIN